MVGGFNCDHIDSRSITFEDIDAVVVIVALRVLKAGLQDAIG